MNPDALDLPDRSPRTAESPTIADAVTHVVDVGERLVTHHLELAIVELRQTIEKLAQVTQLTFAALLLAGIGWVFAMIALLAWLETLGSRALAAAIVAGLQLALAAGLLLNRKRILGRT
jgi:uncharacterized membrane protein YqjE